MSNRLCLLPAKLAVLSLSMVAVGAAGCNGGSGGAATYFPTKLGAIWNFTVTPANGIAYTAMKLNTAGSPSTLTQTYIPSNGSPSTTSSYELDSNGIFITSATSFTSTGGTFLPSQHAYAPPSLILPSDTTPGFSTSSTYTETVQGSTNTTYTVAAAVTIEGIESVVVPAGTFSALKVTRALARTEAVTGTATTSNGVHWYAPGVGSVKTVNQDNLQAVLQTWELTSYNVPQ